MPLVAEVVVAADRAIGQEVVAVGVEPEVGHEVGRGDLVERRLAHLLATDQQPAVDVPVARRFEPGRQQHRRPVDAVEPDDVLADEMYGRPPPGELGLLTRLPVAGGGDVVRQRVEPHVGDVALVPRDRHAPLQRRAADREVEQPTLDEPEDLVASAGAGG